MSIILVEYHKQQGGIALVFGIITIFITCGQIESASQNIEESGACSQKVEMLNIGKQYCVIDLSHEFEEGMTLWPSPTFRYPRFTHVREIGQLVKVESPPDEFWYLHNIDNAI